MIVRYSTMIAAISGLLTVAIAGSAFAQSTGDAKAGEDVFKKCRACHDVGEGAKNKVGPLLSGIVGRKVGTVEGFNYSDANKKAGADGLAWSEAELNTYLLDPRKHMPGNKMAFVGLKDEQDRADIIAYLKTFK